MKKQLIVISLFTFTFQLLTLHAQDTLANKTGGKNIMKLEPYILVSGGLSNPWKVSGYGANTYSSNYDGYGYSGYANSGSAYSFTSGLKIIRGWEVTGMFSYIRNQFDASGIMTETITDFYLNNDVINGSTVNAIGNYYYNNYSYLLGITKSWGGGMNPVFGISLMFGRFITYTPALHGIATGDAVKNGYTITQNVIECYFNMNSEVQGNSLTELNLHVDAPINKHFFFRLLLEMQLSRITNSGGYQYVDMTTGNTVYSGTYPGYVNNSSSFFVGLTDITIGIGYKF